MQKYRFLIDRIITIGCLSCVAFSVTEFNKFYRYLDKGVEAAKLAAATNLRPIALFMFLTLAYHLFIAMEYPKKNRDTAYLVALFGILIIFIVGYDLAAIGSLMVVSGVIAALYCEKNNI